MQEKPMIEITHLDKDTIKFTLKHADLSMANALRRCMIAEVPTLAIETLEMLENSSPLFDEFLAHRIGLIPLNSENVDKINYIKDCCANGCLSCKIPFTLSVKNTRKDKMLVTSLNLKGHHDDLPSIQPADVTQHDLEEDHYADGDDEGMEGKKHIVITKLGRNQELKFKATAIKGIGKDHAKYIPVAVAVFSPEPAVTLNRDVMVKMSDEQKNDVVLSCPSKVFTMYTTDARESEIAVEDELRCIQCQECVKIAAKMNVPDLVTVSVKPNVFRFTVESTGAHKPEQIVKMALKILMDKFREMKSEIAKTVV